MFDIGEKVICVDDSIPSVASIEVFHREFPQWVKKGEKYTIRDIFSNNDIVTSVVVEELVNPILFFPKSLGRSQEASFKATRFRSMTIDEMEMEGAIEMDLVMDDGQLCNLYDTI